MINSNSRSTQLEPGTAGEEVREWAAGEQEKGFFRSVLGALGVHLAQQEAYARGSYSRSVLAIPAGQRASLGISGATWSVYVSALNQGLICGDLYLDGEFYTAVSPTRSYSLELPHRGLAVSFGNISPLTTSMVIYQSYYAEFSENRVLDLGPQPVNFTTAGTGYPTLLTGWSLRETSGTAVADVVLQDGAGGLTLAEFSMPAAGSSVFSLGDQALPAYNGLSVVLTGAAAGTLWVR